MNTVMFLFGLSAIAVGVLVVSQSLSPAPALPPPSPEAALVIEEMRTGPSDWETTDYNGYFHKFYSPSRNLLLHARPSFEPGSNEETAVFVGRVNRIENERWWSSESWAWANPVGPPDSTHILRAAKGLLKDAKPVVRTYPNKLGPVVSRRDAQSESAEAERQREAD